MSSVHAKNKSPDGQVFCSYKVLRRLLFVLRTTNSNVWKLRTGLLGVTKSWICESELFRITIFLNNGFLTNYLVCQEFIISNLNALTNERGLWKIKIRNNSNWQGRLVVLFFARTEDIIVHTMSSLETFCFIIQKIVLLFGI